MSLDTDGEAAMDAGHRQETKATELTIRRATPLDARAIAEVTVTGWQAAYRSILPDDFLDSLRVESRTTAWQEVLARDSEGGTPAWVAERDGRVVGFVGGGPPRDDDVPLPAAEIYAIYVLPDASRQGLGRALLEAAVAHWRGHGTETLVLWVFEANQAARTFYEALGWRPDGARQALEMGGMSAIEVRYRLQTETH
jgi:ribosomal protein S18 acetylase RimI-like enzyme